MCRRIGKDQSKGCDRMAKCRTNFVYDKHDHSREQREAARDGDRSGSIGTHRTKIMTLGSLPVSPPGAQPRDAYVPAGRPRGDGREMSIIAIRSFSSYQQWKRLMPGTSMS